MQGVGRQVDEEKDIRACFRQFGQRRQRFLRRAPAAQALRRKNFIQQGPQLSQAELPRCRGIIVIPGPVLTHHIHQMPCVPLDGRRLFFVGFVLEQMARHHGSDAVERALSLAEALEQRTALQKGEHFANGEKIALLQDRQSGDKLGAEGRFARQGELIEQGPPLLRQAFHAGQNRRGDIELRDALDPQPLHV